MLLVVCDMKRMKLFLKTQNFFLVQAQKAKEREEDEHLVDKLDSDFAMLAQTQAMLSLTRSARMDANKYNSSTIQKDSFGLTAKEIFNKVCS